MQNNRTPRRQTNGTTRHQSNSARRRKESLDPLITGWGNLMRIAPGLATQQYLEFLRQEGISKVRVARAKNAIQTASYAALRGEGFEVKEI